MNKTIYTLTELLQFKGAIPAGASLAVINNEALVSTSHYVAGFLDQLKNGEILVAGNDDIPGIRSISGRQLPKGTAMLVTGASFEFDTTAGVQALGITKADFGKTKAPVCFANGEVEIIQKQRLMRKPGSALTNRYASTGNDNNVHSFAPFLFRSATDISIKTIFADSPTVDMAYKLILHGYEFVEPDQA